MNQLEKQLKESNEVERTGIANSIISLPKFNNVSKGALIEVAKIFKSDNDLLLDEIDRLNFQVCSLKIELQQERNAKKIEMAFGGEYD